MTKFQFLLLGTSLSFIPLTVNAQCVETTNCETLGYTETSCNGGKGVKCPFGNKWFCFETRAEIEDEICTDLGFTESCTGAGQTGSGKSCGGLYAECSCETAYQYSCTGTGYAGGAGSACGGKYAQCSCASGYEWKDGKCQLKISNGAHGDLYYCNGKVVAVKASGMDFYVGMTDLGNMNWSTGIEKCSSYVFCGYEKGALPTKNQLLTMYKNKSTLESLLIANGGTKFSTDDDYCSSTSGTSGVWSSGGFLPIRYSVNMADGSEGRDPDGYARPILEP